MSIREMNIETLIRCHYITTARKSSQSILKEISLGVSSEGLMLKLKLQYFGHLMRRTFEKILMLGKTEGRRRGWQSPHPTPCLPYEPVMKRAGDHQKPWSLAYSSAKESRSSECFPGICWEYPHLNSWASFKCTGFPGPQWKTVIEKKRWLIRLQENKALLLNTYAGLSY